MKFGMEEGTSVIISSVRLCTTEVRALYGRLSCGWLRVVCAWRPWLRWEVGWLARRHRCTPRSWAQRAVRVQWGLSQRPVRVPCRLSYTTVQATIALCAIVDCAFYSISFKEDEVSHKLGKLFQK